MTRSEHLVEARKRFDLADRQEIHVEAKFHYLREGCIFLANAIEVGPELEQIAEVPKNVADFIRGNARREALDWAADIYLEMERNHYTPEFIANAIRCGPQPDASPKGKSIIFGEFVECDTCRAKHGSPLLCVGCLTNRTTIRDLKERLAAIHAHEDAKALVRE